MQEPAANTTGTVFNIQRFSVHDGPGIRTTVFLKGCPLRCRWCCNPESQSIQPEISRNTARCTGCGACIAACPEKALHRNGDVIVLDRQRCKTCASCVAHCPADAISVVGNVMSAFEVAEQVCEDALFYRDEGGMTLSGGEALLQHNFATAICIETHKAGISTALETSAFVKWEVLRQVCQELDYLMIDIKHMDSAKHKAWTGVNNESILHNIAGVSKEFPYISLRLRCPVIPGFNDDEDNIIATARFAGQFRNTHLEFLPYHRLGEGKYTNLGRQYALKDTVPPSPERMAQLKTLAGNYAAMV
ncbi:MAG TPA: glycyl-radical enzyme activating protein [Candidatus Avidesulfovibrio excrementigallinarum]|nr:glycyl-radical enzyme activating protein [Candidatus Avidesulfovibrio excrementigallinarum]